MVAPRDLPSLNLATLRYCRGEPQDSPPDLVDRTLCAAQRAALSEAVDRVFRLLRVNGSQTSYMLAFDVDGTLLDDANQLSRDLVNELRELAQHPRVHVVIATGRAIVELIPVLASLQLPDLWAVCSNGSVTVHTRAIAGRVEFALAHAVKFEAEHAVNALTRQIPGTIFAVEDFGTGFKVTEEFPAGELIGLQLRVSPEELTAEPVTKLVARMPEMERDAFEVAIEAVGLTGLQWCVGSGAWMDAMPQGVSKATGLAALSEHLGVRADATVTVGDSINDIEMLRWAGLGVGVASGNPRALLAADTLVPGVCGEGALAVVRAVSSAAAVGLR